MNVPEDLRYAETHEWVRIERDEARVGITDHAQAELTDIVYIELPAVGASVSAGKAVAVVESVKAASDIYSPVSGTISAINNHLDTNPGLVNIDPYGDGWLFKVELQDPSAANALKDAAAYKAQISA